MGVGGWGLGVGGWGFRVQSSGFGISTLEWPKQKARKFKLTGSGLGYRLCGGPPTQ